MSLWYCSDCKIGYAPGPACPRCGKPGVWQSVNIVEATCQFVMNYAACAQGRARIVQQCGRPTVDGVACELHAGRVTVVPPSPTSMVVPPDKMADLRRLLR